MSPDHSIPPRALYNLSWAVQPAYTLKKLREEAEKAAHVMLLNTAQPVEVLLWPTEQAEVYP